MRWRALFFLPIVFAATLSLVLVGGSSPARAEDGNEAAMEVVDTCASCHDLDTPGYLLNAHRVINQDAELAAHLGVESSCNACHGDATDHLDAGGGEGTIFAFRANEPAVKRSDVCLSCHADSHPRFFATKHAAAGLACTDCHSIHGSEGAANLLASDDEWTEHGAVTASCASCHGEVLAQFEFNERHRLNEGTLDCASCHNPHEPESRLMLAGFKQENCISCHTDKGGPFVFEHASGKVDGCVACHQPHGSPNRHMLTFQSVADVCYSCHLVVPGFHSRFTAETVCTNCHSTIHGSNFHEAFLK